jgi:uncharacterized membrane protein
MTKKLEQLLDLPEAEKPELISPKKVETQTAIVNLQNQLDEFDKISSALPQVKGLGDMSDAELDGLAGKAEQAFDDLMDLGMNVEAKYGSRMFEVAANMLNAAVTAKTNKIDKKLKMVELQLKKLAIDKKNANEGNDSVEGQGFIITDRNSLLEKLKNVDK